MKIARDNELILRVRSNEAPSSPIEVTSMKQVKSLCYTSKCNESSNAIINNGKCYSNKLNKFGKSGTMNLMNIIHDNRNTSNGICNVSVDNNTHKQKPPTRFDHHMKPLRPLPQGKPLVYHPRLGHYNNLMLKSPSLLNPTKRKLNSDDMSQKQQQRSEKRMCITPTSDVEHRTLLNTYMKEKEQNIHAQCVQKEVNNNISRVPHHQKQTIPKNITVYVSDDSLSEVGSHVDPKDLLVDVVEENNDMTNSSAKFNNIALLSIIAAHLSEL